jgi:hypothetical protein
VQKGKELGKPTRYSYFGLWNASSWQKYREYPIFGGKEREKSTVETFILRMPLLTRFRYFNS